MRECHFPFEEGEKAGEVCDYEECSQCEIIASDEVVINGELYWLCEQHLKEHTSDFNKMKSLTDSRVTYWENCYNCANCILSEDPSNVMDICKIDNHEIDYTEDSICEVFLSDWTGLKLGNEKEVK